MFRLRFRLRASSFVKGCQSQFSDWITGSHSLIPGSQVHHLPSSAFAKLSLDFRLTGSYPYISALGLSFVRFTKQVHKTRFRFHKNKFTYSQLRFYRFTNRGSQNKFTKKYKQVHKRRTGGLLLMCQLLCEIHWYVNRYMHAHCYTNRNMHVHCNGINMIKYIDMQKW